MTQDSWRRYSHRSTWEPQRDPCPAYRGSSDSLTWAQCGKVSIARYSGHLISSRRARSARAASGVQQQAPRVVSPSAATALSLSVRKRCLRLSILVFVSSCSGPFRWFENMLSSPTDRVWH